MRLSDFMFDIGEYSFLCGESMSQRHLSHLHLVLNQDDLRIIPAESLLLVFQSGCSSAQDLEELIQWAVNRSASGIVLMGQCYSYLTFEQKERLCGRGIFALILPQSSECCNLIYHASALSLPQYDVETFSQFQDRLQQLCASPYKALDVVLLLNRVLGRSVDMVVGHDFRSLIRHDSLGIVNVPGIIARHAESLVQSDGMHICYNHHSAAAVFPIPGHFAFLAIPLNCTPSVSDFEAAVIQEAIPYLALALHSRQNVCQAFCTQEEFYLAMLSDSLPFDQMRWREEASILGIDFDIPRVVWIAEADSGRLPDTLWCYLSDRLPDSFIHLQGKRLICLSPAAAFQNETQKMGFFDNLLGELDQAFPHLAFLISSSKTCPSLQELPRAYDEAKFSMIIGPKIFPRLRVHPYQRYMLHQVLCSAWGTPALKQIQDNILVPIHTCKWERKTSLTDTLEALIQNSFNISRTAEAMGIHRNTLYKLIEKIGQILHMDMYNSQNRTILYIAMKIDQISRIFPGTERDASWTLEQQRIAPP